MISFSVPKSEIDQRIGAFQNALKKNDIGGVLIVQRTDLFYFSGTAQTAYLFIPADREPILLVKKYYPRARRESPISTMIELKSVKQIPDYIQDYYGRLPEVIGLELDVMPVVEFEFYKTLVPAKQYRDASPLILACRSIKSDWEIAQIEQTAALSAQTFDHIHRILVPGISEMEFSGMVETFARRLGHGGRMRTRHYQTEAYPWHILSGESGGKVGMLDAPASGEGTSCAFPCGSGFKLLKSDEPIMVDFSFIYNGYHTDETRMFAVHSMPEQALRASRTAIDILHSLIDVIKPGADVHDVFKHAEKAAKDFGYEDAYLGPPDYKVTFVGHGVGLELVEPPFIAANRHEVLKPGMVFALEPKLVFQDQFCAGVESMIRVTETGASIISKVPDEVFIL